VDTSLTSIQQHFDEARTARKVHRMSADDLRQVELQLKAIIDRIDAVHALARDLQHVPELTAEDTKGLDKLEEALKESIRKNRGE
jgi:hypothetical protein